MGKAKQRCGLHMRVQLWSSGGGTQSAAIAALIVRGDLPKPDLAVIADTGMEQGSTWEYMDEVISPALANVGVILHRASAREYAKVGLYGGVNNGTLLIPAFTNQRGEPGKMPGYCSSEWKRRVVQRFARSRGITAADVWLGISTDELRRVPAATTGRWRNRCPLVELRMNRGDCVALVESMGWPTPPRSSCWMCPNHTQAEWREINGRKKDWDAAVAFDKAIRRRDPDVYVHSDCKPLDEVDLSDQNGVLFGHECDSGHCFV